MVRLQKQFEVTEMNGYNVFGVWTETDRQTATLNYEISAVWEMKPRTVTQKTSRLLMGPYRN